MSEDGDPRPPVDDVGFNDPGAWAFCPYCAFEVAVFDRALASHQRYRTGSNDEECRGSGRTAVWPTPVEATALVQIDLRKSLSQQTRRAYWARQRQAARRRAADFIAKVEMQPTKVTVTNLATGVEVDMTDQVVGPVLLNTEDSDGREDVAE